MKKSIFVILIILGLWSSFLSVSAEEEGIIFTPTSQNCDEFSGWDGRSGLKRYDGVTTAPTGGGTALFTVPETLDGWTDIYYYVPYYATGYGSTTNNCSATLVVTDKDGKKSILLL